MRIKLFIVSALAIGIVGIAQAQQAGIGFGSRTQMLVTNKAVQEELKLSNEQVAKVKDWANRFKDTAQKIRKDKGVDFNAPGGFNAELIEKLLAANVEIDRVAYKELGDLLKPDQIKRLKELHRQLAGFQAFSDADVVDALKLTEAQKTAILGLGADLIKERRDLMKEVGLGGKGGLDPEKLRSLRTKTQVLEKEYVAKAVDKLNEDQKKTWTSLIGTPFDADKLFQPMRKD